MEEEVVQSWYCSAMVVVEGSIRVVLGMDYGFSFPDGRQNGGLHVSDDARNPCECEWEHFIIIAPSSS
jgi:hypothetical protein